MLQRQHPDKQTGSNISDYYKRNLTIPILDHLSNELDTRFDAGCSQNLTEFMQLLPFQAFKITSRLRPENFSSHLQLYGSDLPVAEQVEWSPWAGSRIKYSWKSVGSTLTMTTFRTFTPSLWSWPLYLSQVVSVRGRSACWNFSRLLSAALWLRIDLMDLHCCSITKIYLSLQRKLFKSSYTAILIDY